MIFMGGFCFGQVNILVVDMSHFKEIPISEHFSILISDNQSEAISINYYAGLTYKLKKDLLISKYCLWGHTNVLQK
jgi:hypothetical protein